MIKTVAIAASLALPTLVMGSAGAADLKVFLPVSLQHTADQVVPPFERSAGHKVTITYGTAGAVAAKVRDGEAADVLVSTRAQIDDLQTRGKIAAGSGVGIAKVGVGLLVRKGAPKPDIGSADAFKAAMLAAKAVSYTDPALGGPAGIYVAKLFDRLGIGVEMQKKTKLSGAGAAVSTTVVNGDADIGFIMINEILADARVDYVGPLPPAIQGYTPFAAGRVAGSGQQDAAQAFIAMLSSPDTLAVMQKLGFEGP